MLVRNLTKVSLPLRKHGQKILLLPGKATEVPDTLFSKEQVKNIYGSFVQILNEELVRDEEPVVQQTIEITVEDNAAAAVKELISASKEEKKEEVKEETSEPANTAVTEEVNELETVTEIGDKNDIEEISLGAIAGLAEEAIEDVKAEVKEKPAKKAAKKTTAKKATKKK